MMKRYLSNVIVLGLMTLSVMASLLYSVNVQAVGLDNYCAAFPGPAQTWETNSQTKAYLGFKSLITGTYKEGGVHYLWLKLETNSGLPGRGDYACDGDACLFPTSSQPNRWATKLNLGAFQVTSSTAYYQAEQPKLSEYGSFDIAAGVTESLENGQGHKIKRFSVAGGSTVHLYAGTYWFEKMELSKGSQVITHGKVIIHVKGLSIADASKVFPQSDNPDDLRLYEHVGEHEFLSQVRLTKGSQFTGLLYSEESVNLEGGQCSSSTQCEITTITGSVTTRFLKMDSSYEAPSAIINGQSACFNPKEYFIDITPEKDESLTCDRQKVTFRVLDKDKQIATDYTGQINLSTSLTNANKAEWFTAENDGQSLGDAKEHREITPINGQKTLWLKSNHIGNITVTATLSTDDKKTDSGTFLFVPYGFEIADGELPLVAGKPVDIEIKALACPTDKGGALATEYQGQRTLTLNTRYDAPADGQQYIQLAKPNTTEWQSHAIALSFVKGKAQAQLRYIDAGRARLTLTDEQCTSVDCNVIPAVQRVGLRALEGWQGLTGTQSIKARPYTFALCDAPNERSIEQAKGTALNTENVFVAAGERFSTKVKAVIWMSDDAGKDNIDAAGNATKLVDTRNLCGRVETPNFYQALAPAATVQLSIPAGENAKPHSPNVAGARPGTLTSQSLSHQQIEDNAFYASWSEVGSIQLRAGVQGVYLGMKVNMGYRPVGRFYPKFFQVQAEQSDIAYPEGQSFVYMNQPFTGHLSVQALNQQKTPTYNYGYFASHNQIGVQVVAVDRDAGAEQGNSLLERMDFSLWPTEWEKNWQEDAITVPPSTLLFARSALAPFMVATSRREATYRVETQPDGPYAVMLGVAREEKKPSECLQIGCPELQQPDLMVFNCKADSMCATPVPAQSFATFTTRYGRMVMDDTAGRSGTPLAIPLRVEYWNGAAFVPHRDDSVSAFDGQYYCKQILMQSDASVESDTFTLGQGVVDKGNAASGQLLAQPDDTPQYREQTRFWQKLVDQTPAQVAADDPAITCDPGAVDRNGESQPWLLYNWRQQGDENPSALVTFGTYRGNDRVIYRGEKGMNVRLP